MLSRMTYFFNPHANCDQISNKLMGFLVIDKYLQPNDINYQRGIQAYLEAIHTKKEELSVADREYLYVLFKFMHFLKSKFDLTNLMITQEDGIIGQDRYDVDQLKLTIHIPDTQTKNGELININCDDAMDYLKAQSDDVTIFRRSIGLVHIIASEVTLPYKDIKHAAFTVDIDEQQNPQTSKKPA